MNREWNFTRAAMAVAVLSVCSASASAQFWGFGNNNRLEPNQLIISRSVYDNNPNNVTVGEILPPNCKYTTGGCGASTGAPYNGTYPYVFNNDIYDGSFGITSKLYLDQYSLWGLKTGSIEVPNSDEGHLSRDGDHLVTSFSSKSEGALNLSTDGDYLTFIDYVAGVNAIDASNSNTPGVIDPTNPVGVNPTTNAGAYYRAVARVGADGKFTFTETNAYSGNNGRAAIYNDAAQVFYTAGNAGNGSNPQPNGVILGAGAQLIPFDGQPEADQNPGLPTPVASFNVTELGDKTDKIGKDDNFRGLRIFNNVIYLTKGSGSNGVNTVYFVDTTGKACPNGVGLPVAGATLPTAPLSYDASTLQTDGLPSNMCILAGFPTTLAKKLPTPPLQAPSDTTSYPFGIWFANATTLYVADEGDGYNGTAASGDMYSHAAAQTTAGLQKWIFDSSTNQWQFAYVITKGLNIGTPYTVSGYPTGTNAATGLPWAPATDGLRNITGFVGPDGQAVIYAVSSTVSGGGDQGADPNKVFVVVDKISNTNATSAPTFSEVESAKFDGVLRGVSLSPNTDFTALKDGYGILFPWF
jgi:hypothetical protein